MRSRSRRRRRFHHGGVYFADTSGLRAALIDAGQLTLCLEALLGKRGLLDVELVPARGGGRGAPHPQSAVTVRAAFEALESAYRVFSDCASVVERVWQGQEQLGIMLDAAEASPAVSARDSWLLAYELVSRIADGHSPVRRDALTLARAQMATLRVWAPARAERAREREKARESRGDPTGG